MARWAPQEIVSAALVGDEIAAEQLVSVIWPGCFRLAATVIGDRTLAQDAAQEACVIVLRKIRTLRSAGAFDTWLYRIVMREAARVRRKYHESLSQPAFEDFVTVDSATPIDVWRALAGLSADLRDVTVLFYFDDLKTEEIASILGVAHATVRSRLTRARDRLRGLLGDYGNEILPNRQEKEQHAF